jgi:hypothetical protein
MADTSVDPEGDEDRPWELNEIPSYLPLQEPMPKKVDIVLSNRIYVSKDFFKKHHVKAQIKDERFGVPKLILSFVGRSPRWYWCIGGN